MRPTKILAACAVWSEYSLPIWRNFAYLTIRNTSSEISDQTAPMPNFGGRTSPKERFLTSRLYKYYSKEQFGKAESDSYRGGGGGGRGGGGVIKGWPSVEAQLLNFISMVSILILQQQSKLVNSETDIQYNLNGSNPDGSFTVDDSNSFFSSYKILQIAQENKYLGIFFLILSWNCMMCVLIRIASSRWF